jgi:hypothetical protein
VHNGADRLICGLDSQEFGTEAQFIQTYVLQRDRYSGIWDEKMQNIASVPKHTNDAFTVKRIGIIHQHFKGAASSRLIS